MCSAFNPWFAARQGMAATASTRQGIIVTGEDTESEDDEYVYNKSKYICLRN